MIVVDASALLAIVPDEPERARFRDTLVANDCLVAAPTALEDQLRLARQAFDLYGRGRGHPARLNFGDCMSYALARHRDLPLLYKGDDFPHTDVKPVRIP